MADWRQIQARIRKAKLSADPIPALTRIYDRTRDGMAAFELATVHENAGRMEEAVGWYAKAWQRFRRADWKQKSLEAIDRLGGTQPQEATPAFAAEAGEGVAASASAGFGRDAFTSTTEMLRDEGDAQAVSAEGSGVSQTEEAEAIPMEAADASAGATQAAVGSIKRRSRRGRRGGRRHRRKREQQMDGQQTQNQTQQAPPVEPLESGVASVVEVPPRPEEHERGRARTDERERRRELERPHRPPAASPSKRREIEPAEPAGVRVGSEWAAQARAVDPGLASRMAKLEAKLRRLMASPVYGMNEIEEAPAGPGVFVLSDSDHTTYYYVEACRTLRIALTNIGRARTMEGSLKSKFAEHLGISESQVGKYIKEHCVARWLQLDEDSSRLAHFAIAVLGPVLND